MLLMVALMFSMLMLMAIDIINIPEKIGGKLFVGAGVCEAQLSRVSLGLSQNQQPKATLEFTITSEMSENTDEWTSMGERVLETCSLQEQAIWKLNDYFEQVATEQLPAGKMSGEDFQALMNEKLVGTNWTLELILDKDDKDNDRTKVSQASFNE